MPRQGKPWDFPPSKPLPAEGGIATSRQRGAMAEAWWSKRFVDVLESFGLGGRMQRGRRYARAGQVLSLDVAPGRISAKVQGSRRTPYTATVVTAPPTPEQWARIADAMRARVGFVARLLEGEVPHELEAVFTDAGAQLFPRSWREVGAECSCPDWESPCKHLAAALYVFADRLDRDPWLLLAWRGSTRDELLGALAPATTGDAGSTSSRVPTWWPLTPGTVSRATPAHTGAAIDLPPPETPEVPTIVLRRLAAELAPAGGEATIDVRLAPAYVAFASGPQLTDEEPSDEVEVSDEAAPKVSRARRRARESEERRVDE